MVYPQTGPADTRQLWWALLTALGLHLLVLLGVNFVLPEPPPRQPVFSLQLALTERAGGDPGDALAGARQPLPPGLPLPRTTPAVDVGAEPGSQFVAIDSRRGDWSTRSEPQRQSAPPSATTVPGMTPDGLIALGERSALLPESFSRRHSDSRDRHRRDEARATPVGQYAERWRLRVQRIGTENFPEVARRLGLTGRLTLEVGIRADGGLHSVRLLSSSGHPELDTAARRIVMLSAPYEPFPDELRRQYDILHIVRTWEFDQGNRLRSRN
jgi:protein TonB